MPFTKTNGIKPLPIKGKLLENYPQVNEAHYFSFSIGEEGEGGAGHKRTSRRYQWLDSLIVSREVKKRWIFGGWTTCRTTTWTPECCGKRRVQKTGRLTWKDEGQLSAIRNREATRGRCACLCESLSQTRRTWQQSEPIWMGSGARSGMPTLVRLLSTTTVELYFMCLLQLKYKIETPGKWSLRRSVIQHYVWI